ncbi:hypothetical protein MTR_1g114550 [Medicago truncatula]|uniref:Uncharacterized protein n=1 Tax=Medicago truncatula TaxID=3880 RepID=G7IEA5_MEDTR|nr:hypothetical protein MTR_1g114550 [Medicago truncatula]
MKGTKIAIFLIGGQNCNIMKHRGRKVQFSLNIIMPLLLLKFNIERKFNNIGITKLGRGSTSNLKLALF